MGDKLSSHALGVAEAARGDRVAKLTSYCNGCWLPFTVLGDISFGSGKYSRKHNYVRWHKRSLTGAVHWAHYGGVEGWV